MFSSCVFCFVALSPKRRHILQCRVKALNGKVVDCGTDSSVTHVIVDESLADNLRLCSKQISKHCGQIVTGIQYLSVKWLCECLKQKKFIPYEDYRLNVIDQGENNVPSSASKEREICRERKRSHSPECQASSSKTDDENRQNYLCSKPSPTKKIKSIDNEAIIGELQKLADTYRATNDTWRLFSYEKAISAISKYNKPITTFQEALAIPGVGEKLAMKVMEVIESGAVRKVAEVSESEEAKTLELFCGVWGAGPATAEAWYRQGYRTLDQVRESANITQQQKVGLRLYDDFNQRIPRSEVAEIGAVINSVATAIHPGLSTLLVGSFRRGKDSSGDVDVLITNPGPLAPSEVLHKLLTNLKDQGLVTDDLTMVSESKQQRKWLGVARLRPDLPHRRLDLFVVPSSEQSAALLHFSGSALFNRSIRLLAARNGMCLTEHGLYSGTVRRGNEVIHEGHIIPTETEEDIFKHLLLEYRPPEERDH